MPLAQNNLVTARVFAGFRRIVHIDTESPTPGVWSSDSFSRSADYAKGRCLMLRLKKQQQRASSRSTHRAQIGFEALEHRVVLSTFRVNTLLDTVAVNHKTGKDGSGHVSLRSALQTANLSPLADVIILPAGTFNLTIFGSGENNAATGDLDIRRNVTIKGAGAGKTIIDGEARDRVFDILGATVTISGMTIQHGAANDGGGLLNEGGKVTISNVTFQSNFAFGQNGSNGLQGAGGVSIGTKGGAGQDGTDARGGGVLNASGSVTITGSSFTQNLAFGGNGGVGGIGALGQGFSGGSGASGQAGTGGGGGTGGHGGSAFGAGVYNAKGAIVTLINSVFFANSAFGGGGGAGGNGSKGGGGKGGDENDGVGSGGLGTGGAGGAGGDGGTAAGGAVYNLGTVKVGNPDAGFTNNSVLSGPGGAGGAGAVGSGGAGGNGTTEDSGGNGGGGTGGAGGIGGNGGSALGGCIFNGGVISGSEVTILTNTATGSIGGTGGKGGSGFSGAGGTAGSSQIDSGGAGGRAIGGSGGGGGIGGLAEGGGLFNAGGASFTLTAPKNASHLPVSNFTTNVAQGGNGGSGGGAGGAFAGVGGSGGSAGTGGTGGLATGGRGGTGGDGSTGQGGGLFDTGRVSITIVNVNITGNRALGGDGGRGGDSNDADAGNGGDGRAGGHGGSSEGGNGGNGGVSGSGIGGGITVSQSGNLTLSPRVLPTKHGVGTAAQADTITGNQALEAAPGSTGLAGFDQIGIGGSPDGLSGFGVAGKDGAFNPLQIGSGGGVAAFGNTVIDHTKISGNTASTQNNDVVGTIKT